MISKSSISLKHLFLDLPTEKSFTDMSTGIVEGCTGKSQQKSRTKEWSAAFTVLYKSLALSSELSLVSEGTFERFDLGQTSARVYLRIAQCFLLSGARAEVLAISDQPATLSALSQVFS